MTLELTVAIAYNKLFWLLNGSSNNQAVNDRKASKYVQFPIIVLEMVIQDHGDPQVRVFIFIT